MKVTTRLVIVLLFFVSILRCTTKKEKYPLDFGFKVVYETAIINSFDSTYIRNYREGDSIIKIQFSNAELQKIYDKIIENGLDKYLDNFCPNCKIMRIPSFETKFQFKINDITKNLTYKFDCRYFPVLGYLKTRKLNKVNKALTLINDIVTNKPEVKRLSNSNIFFY
jgi:hypothetical protein